MRRPSRKNAARRWRVELRKIAGDVRRWDWALEAAADLKTHPRFMTPRAIHRWLHDLDRVLKKVYTSSNIDRYLWEESPLLAMLPKTWP